MQPCDPSCPQITCSVCETSFPKKDPCTVLSLPLPDTFAQTYKVPPLTQIQGMSYIQVSVVPWSDAQQSRLLVMGLRAAPWSSVGELLEQLLNALAERDPSVPPQETWKVSICLLL